MKHVHLFYMFILALTGNWQILIGQNEQASLFKTVNGQTVTSKNVTDSPLIGYRYNGLDLLLCPLSYTCGELGSPVPPDEKIPYSCCSGFIIIIIILFLLLLLL